MSNKKKHKKNDEKKKLVGSIIYVDMPRNNYIFDAGEYYSNKNDLPSGQKVAVFKCIGVARLKRELVMDEE